MGLVVTALCGSFCITCLRPLTRRYVQLIFRTSLLDIHENLRLLITQQVSKLISPLLASTVSLASLSSLGKSPFGDA
ncbi:hypothetical protein CIK04_13170 [Vibrio sp. 03_296]|nr:hypothetical protein CIK04_13170 [Vibrio sp. 03_296]PJO13695.1 hypothetical protein COO31_007940 [Vibrio vulnificus]